MITTMKISSVNDGLPREVWDGMVYEPVTLVDWAGFKSFWLEGSPTFFLFVKNQNKTDGLNFFSTDGFDNKMLSCPYFKNKNEYAKRRQEYESNLTQLIHPVIHSYSLHFV
jgi:hypothetical protein